MANFLRQRRFQGIRGNLDPYSAFLANFWRIVPLEAFHPQPDRAIRIAGIQMDARQSVFAHVPMFGRVDGVMGLPAAD